MISPSGQREPRKKEENEKLNSPFLRSSYPDRQLKVETETLGANFVVFSFSVQVETGKAFMDVVNLHWYKL